jgi:RNA polymerase sigma-70 factor (ECF subfamily)
VRNLTQNANQDVDARSERIARTEELVAAAQAGSACAFSELYSLSAKSVYALAYSITGSREDAEDVQQDSFLRAIANIGHFRGDSQFSSWVSRIAINLSLMILRKRRVRRETPVDGKLDANGETTYLDLDDPRPDPEQLLIQKREYDRLLQLLEKLPPKMRAALELKAFRECSVEETGRLLGMSESAAKSRLFRARRQFEMLKDRQKLKEAGACRRRMAVHEPSNIHRFVTP